MPKDYMLFQFYFINLFHLMVSLEGGCNEFTCIDFSSSKYTVHITQTESFFLFLGKNVAESANHDTSLK